MFLRVGRKLKKPGRNPTQTHEKIQNSTQNLGSGSKREPWSCEMANITFCTTMLPGIVVFPSCPQDLNHGIIMPSSFPVLYMDSESFHYLCLLSMGKLVYMLTSLCWSGYLGVLPFALFTMNRPRRTHLSTVPSHLGSRLLSSADILLAGIQRASCTCVFSRSLTVLNINVGIISEAPKELRNAGPAVIGEICVFPSGKTIVKINLVSSRETALCLKAYAFIQAGETAWICVPIESELFG